MPAAGGDGAAAAVSSVSRMSSFITTKWAIKSIMCGGCRTKIVINWEKSQTAFVGNGALAQATQRAFGAHNALVVAVVERIRLGLHRADSDSKPLTSFA